MLISHSFEINCELRFIVHSTYMTQASQIDQFPWHSGC